MNNVPPKILYKYANWEKDFHKRLITNNEIYFASAKQFNDPYDCRIPIRYDLLNDNQWRQIIKRHVSENNSNLSDAEIERETDIVFNRRLWETPEILRENERMQQEFAFKRNRFLCLSEINDSILMWSYYANSHEGFCIGIDIIRLLEFFDKTNIYPGCGGKFAKINYVSKFPQIVPPTEENNIQFFEDVVANKEKQWAHEREWRYILTLNNDFMSRRDITLILPDGIITEIYLGCEMREDHKEEIIRIVRAKSVRPRLFTAVKSKDSFSLHFEEIN